MPSYTYTNSDALKNRLGITETDELQPVEAALTEAAIQEILAGHGPKGAFDGEHLKSIHSHIFQDVYEWAGHTRDECVALSDGTVASEPVMRKVNGVEFARGSEIQHQLQHVALKIKDANFLKGLSQEEFANRAADIMSELNSVHPFREGNGRTQRVFMQELAKEAGHPLDFSVISQERMAQASIAAHERNNLEPMRRLFQDASHPERRAALREAIVSIEAAEAAKIDWNSRYI